MVKNEGGVGQAQARDRAARWGPEVGTAERRRGTFGQMAAEAMGVALSLHPSFCSLCSLYLLPAPLLSLTPLGLILVLFFSVISSAK